MIGVKLIKKSPTEIYVRISQDSPVNSTNKVINRTCIYEDGYILQLMDDGTTSEIKFADIEGTTIDRALTTHDETTFYHDLLTHLQRIYNYRATRLAKEQSKP